MNIHKNLLSVTLTLGLLLSGGLLNSVWSQSESQLLLDDKRVPWANLSYQAKTFWVDVSTSLHLEALAADDVKAALLENRQGVALPVPPEGAFQLTSDTIIDSIFQPPVKIFNRVWFDPKDATALGRVRLRRGEDDFKKIYRFTQQGVFRHRREPGDQQEVQKDPQKWSDVLDTFYAYDPARLGCGPVSERLLLIYIATAAERIDKNKPVSVCVFGKRQLFEVQLRSAGLQAVKVDYVEKKHQRPQHRQGKVEAHKIILEARPLESDLDAVENFSFLGFRKNIAFFVDPASKLPVQVSGEIPTAGKAILKLREVQLR